MTQNIYLSSLNFTFFFQFEIHLFSILVYPNSTFRFISFILNEIMYICENVLSRIYIADVPLEHVVNIDFVLDSITRFDRIWSNSPKYGQLKENFSR